MSDLEFEQSIVGKLQDKFGEKVTDVKTKGPRMISLNAKKDIVRDLVKFMIDEYSMDFITYINGVDVGEDIELVYHLVVKDPSSGQETTVSAKTRVPKNNPEIESVVDLIPGVIVYERETQDLIGAKFKGITDPRRLILPDDWPDGVYPLRKDYPNVPPGEVK